MQKIATRVTVRAHTTLAQSTPKMAAPEPEKFAFSVSCAAFFRPLVMAASPHCALVVRAQPRDT
jgi:hypothetical protein